MAAFPSLFFDRTPHRFQFGLERPALGRRFAARQLTTAPTHQRSKSKAEPPSMPLTHNWTRGDPKRVSEQWGLSARTSPAWHHRWIYNDLVQSRSTKFTAAEDSDLPHAGFCILIKGMHLTDADGSPCSKIPDFQTSAGCVADFNQCFRFPRGPGWRSRPLCSLARGDWRFREDRRPQSDCRWQEFTSEMAHNESTRGLAIRREPAGDQNPSPELPH